MTRRRPLPTPHTAKKPIPYSRPAVDESALREIAAVLRSGWLTTGPTVERFERAFAQRVGARHAVAFSSGTSALVGACAAAGLTAKDHILTSTMSFVASANCGRYFGATVDLCDVEEPTLNVTAETLRHRWRRGTKAVVAVHYMGHPADLAPISDLCRRKGAVLIEDAAHAVGATYRGSTIGDCRYSDLCCFSFHPTKLITTGEGGMVTTNRDDLADRLRTFRNHGITRPGGLEPWEYDCAEVSFNWRLSDVNCALGLAQLSQMDKSLSRRREIAAYYNRRFADDEAMVTPVELPGCTHAYHLYVLRFRLTKLTIDRRGIYDALRTANIVPQVHYRPIHRHTAYRALGYHAKDFPVAERAYKAMLSLPMYPGLTRREMTFVADTVCRIADRHRRRP